MPVEGLLVLCMHPAVKAWLSHSACFSLRERSSWPCEQRVCRVISSQLSVRRSGKEASQTPQIPVMGLMVKLTEAKLLPP